ncbi:glutaredoxin 3 [Pantoea sp. RIT-PI-b]|uniref:glutaredoxin 3 n=1 Tax=Pantoea sp. RIT-PI-b TaxID=1681195 RepID=UPI0021008765|nr:glutaredoxin 3 [Pantoea sp. RIT-PI-b]
MSLRSTSGELIDLSALEGRIVVYAYPMTAVPGIALPSGWDEIPGARGCSPQNLSFQAEKDVFAALGVTILGLSTQTTEYQQEMTGRLGLSVPVLSDSDFKFADALHLPTMTIEGMRLLKRLTLIINKGTIEKVFYPVFPADQAAAQVIEWLNKNTFQESTSGVVIYTTQQCPYCKSAKQLLQGKNIAFTEIDIEHDPQAASVMMIRSNGRRTVPQVFVGSTHLGGADELLTLERRGQLDAMLKGA